jgi:hypothetical protein
MKKFLTAFAIMAFSFMAFSQGNDPSLLSEGNWYKIKVVESGVYRLTYGNLFNLGINMLDLDPANIRMYGNGGGMLPHTASELPAEDFEEIAIYVHNQASGVFNFFDYILFYGTNTTTHHLDEETGFYHHQLNFFADTTVYFLTIGDSPGKRIDTVFQTPDTPTDKILTYHDFAFHEAENMNLLKSGREWFGEEFTDGGPQSFPINIPGLIDSERLTMHWRVAASSPVESYFELRLNGVWMDSLALDPVTNIYEHIKDKTGMFAFFTDSPNLNLTINYSHPDPESIGWLDYISVNFQRDMRMAGEQFHFRDIETHGPDIIGHFTISDGTDDLMVWEVTDHNNTSRVETTFYEETRWLDFIIPLEELREFVAFSPRELMTPAKMEVMVNQDIRGLPAADMLIITHSTLMTEAEVLADFHTTHSGLTVHTIDVNKIYNEFSSGKQDVVAIRDMIRLFYDKAEAKNQSLQYVLMFGMGSYDYKNRITPNHNLVPVYQSLNSLDPLASYATDDFFASLEDGKGNWDVTNNAETLDVAIGRLPATNVEEAKAMVDKIVHYASNPQRFGSWKNVYTLVADDGDTGLHMNVSELVSETIEATNPNFNLQKIYLDEFELEQTPDGPRYPGANEAIKQALNQGTLVFNFIGHSGPEGLAGERVLTSDDIQALDNHDNLPMVIVLGSQYNNISDPGVSYQGNELILGDEQGAIAVIAPNRPVYSGVNNAFNNALAGKLNADGAYSAFGDMVREAKNEAIHLQHRRYILLGDPALKLALPQYQAEIDSVIGIAFNVFSDTLAPGQGVVVKGSIVDDGGTVISGFNGTIHLTLFDRAYEETTMGNQGDPFVMLMRDDMILTVESTVTSGGFEAQFMLPGDMSRDYDLLKLSWYAMADDMDAAGANFLVAGGGPFGIGDNLIAEGLVRIYPTVTSDIVYIDFAKERHGFNQISILDLAGNEVIRQNIAGKNNVQLNLAKLPAGVYIAFISGEAGSVRQKLIVN